MKFIVQSTKLKNDDYSEKEKFEKKLKEGKYQKKTVISRFHDVEEVYVKDFESLEDALSFCKEEAESREVVINTTDYDLPALEIVNDWRE